MITIELDMVLLKRKMKLKDLTKTVAPAPQVASTTPNMVKVKRTVQKLDENGQPMYKTITVEKKKGCGCKGKAQETVVEEQRVPDTVEVWVEVPQEQAYQSTQQINQADSQIDPSKPEPLVFCKLYGTVPENFCLRCNSYKK